MVQASQLAQTATLTEPEFRTALAEHIDAANRIAHIIARSSHDAEDLLQDALHKALRNRERFRKGSNFKAWLLTILRNTNISHHRKARLRVTADYAELEPYLPADEPVAEEPRTHRWDELDELAEQLDDEVRAAIDELPEDFRDVLLLVGAQGKSYAETAAALGIPVGTVMSRLFRARKLLHARLSDYARDELSLEPALAS